MFKIFGTTAKCLMKNSIQPILTPILKSGLFFFTFLHSYLLVMLNVKEGQPF